MFVLSRNERRYLHGEIDPLVSKEILRAISPTGTKGKPTHSKQSHGINHRSTFHMRARSYAGVSIVKEYTRLVSAYDFGSFFITLSCIGVRKAIERL